jgi:hypothetical protein
MLGKETEMAAWICVDMPKLGFSFELETPKASRTKIR